MERTALILRRRYFGYYLYCESNFSYRLYFPIGKGNFRVLWYAQPNRFVRCRGVCRKVQRPFRGRIDRGKKFFFQVWNSFCINKTNLVHLRVRGRQNGRHSGHHSEQGQAAGKCQQGTGRGDEEGGDRRHWTVRWTGCQIGWGNC